MDYLVRLLMILHAYCVVAEIQGNALLNKLVKVKPVGANIVKSFLPLTEIPPPRRVHFHDGRRHLDEDCNQKPRAREVYEGPNVAIVGDYYDDHVGKTVATVIIPDHIDHMHFDLTTQVPYFTVGSIEAIGHHPTTRKTDSCEKIYQDHMAAEYSDETTDYSEESLEMARMPLVAEHMDSNEVRNLYSDLSM